MIIVQRGVMRPHLSVNAMILSSIPILGKTTSSFPRSGKKIKRGVESHLSAVRDLKSYKLKNINYMLFSLFATKLTTQPIIPYKIK